MKKIICTFIVCLPLITRAQIEQSAIDKEADVFLSTALSDYTYLHSHPELSRSEASTAAFLKKEMKSLGLEIIDSLGYSSFLAILRNGEGPTILYRTDMDGLPIKEETDLSFASKAVQKRGEESFPVMHACGHDIHMSTWLATARIMKALKKEWKGTILFLAQSAEETGQGAKKIVSSANFLSIPKPDKQLAIHCQAELPAGTLGFCDGFAMAAVDMMTVVIHGKGGHGAAPEKCIDPIVMAAQFINQIQTIVSRNLASTEPAVITVGAIHGGTAHNIIPNDVTLKLTVRSFSAESRKKILDRIRLIGNSIALSAGMDGAHMPDYDLGDMSIPAVYNEPNLGAKLKKQIETFKGKEAIREVKPVMLGEDFGVYGNIEPNIPSYLIWLGTANPKMEDTEKNIFSLHTSKFAPSYQATLNSSLRIIPLALFGLLKEKAN